MVVWGHVQEADSCLEAPVLEPGGHGFQAPVPTVAVRRERGQDSAGL